MIIKSFKINKSLIWLCISSIALIVILLICYFVLTTPILPVSGQTEKYIYSNDVTESKKKKDYIKWFEFKVSYEILDKTSKLDINSHQKNEAVKYNWVELISYLACKYQNNFSKFKQADLDKLVAELKSGKTIEGYDSALHEFIGEYQIEIKGSNSTEKKFEEKYGLKAFCPIAKGYSFSHYDDFGASRSYGYKRVHFGNDLMGNIGTPVIAVESGIVEAVGWNQYGGWRVGIRSFDKKRYYYYAHLRKNHPYAENIKEGQIVQAGDVIGYLGMTGYSTKENVNNINVPHLHFGIQLIFDEVQKEGPNQIWCDLYDLVNFLQRNRSEVYKSNQETKDYSRKIDFIDSNLPD